MTDGPQPTADRSGAPRKHPARTTRLTSPSSSARWVVFGDIGTSPSDPHLVPVSVENVYGVVSLT